MSDILQLSLPSTGLSSSSPSSAARYLFPYSHIITVLKYSEVEMGLLALVDVFVEHLAGKDLVEIITQ